MVEEEDVVKVFHAAIIAKTKSGRMKMRYVVSESRCRRGIDWHKKVI